MPRAVASDEGARVGAAAPMTGGLRRRSFKHHLRRIGQKRARGVAGQNAGRAEPRARRVGAKISREEAVRGEVAAVVAIVVEPAARIAIAQRTDAEILGLRRACTE